ncbi:alpha-hydroxy-acid oxidizing protein [Megasphaera paucivorans]|uniref:L-lactate oxidase n=1 Tax=Megasphaera paucivorans TaxID=349095 RepID=A0A1G9Q830_9FIRM|nr:alpha-hydroxy-acid oxidizing protein [Megasphaera paucivorans]SDM07099.1 FMN-dependent dehydrogenase, includes L-lactate dehydrogenase and type II isopentenyl diphosphate isomerase [Megasphaera paucivorans]
MEKKEVMENARKKMKGCHVCPECNGLACRGQIPGFGGLRTGRSFMRNVESLKEYGLIMRSMAGIEEPDTRTEIFGHTLSLPVLVAPVGGIVLNAKVEGDPQKVEEDYCDAVTQGAIDAGTIAFTGDSGAAYMYASGIRACKAHPGLVIPTIKPRDDEAIIEKAKLAEEAGAPAVASDIDAATLINMRIFGQPVGPKSAASIKKIADSVAIPFIVKGVMSKEEALACVEAGAKGIVVSNHGGRILDGMAGTADVLPEIAAAVKGKLTIFVDGGIRSGEDVLKMLALGADACLIGRPAAWGAIGGGAEGVKIILDGFKRELSDAMMITGTASAKHVSSNILMKL